MAALYSKILLDHFRHPRNYGDLEEPDASHESFNPLCGDRIRIEVKLDHATIQVVRFKGDGCAISMAAASLLTEIVTGMEIAEARALTDERLIEALESDIQPARIQCVALPLEAFLEGLKARGDFEPQRHEDTK